MLCENGILENQATSIQDSIIYKLHEVINKYSFDEMQNTLEAYGDYIGDNPRPEKLSCDKSGINYESYINSLIIILTEDSTYYKKDKNDDPFMDNDKREAAEKCANVVRNFLIDKNILTDNVSKKYYGKWELNPFFRENLNKIYDFRLKHTKFPSGKSHDQYLVELLDLHPTYSAVYDHVLGTNSNSQQYGEILKKIVSNPNNDVMEVIKKIIVKSDNNEVKECFGRINNDDPNVGLFFNTILGDCFKDVQKWSQDFRNYRETCSDAQKDLFYIFENLTALGQDVNKIKKFIVEQDVEQDHNILRNVIDKNCKEKRQYQFPKTSCENYYIPAALGSVTDIGNWKFFKMFQQDLDDYLKSDDYLDYLKSDDYLKSIEDKDKQFNIWLFSSFLYDKYGDKISSTYRSYVSDIIFNEDNRHVYSKKEILSYAKSIGKSYLTRKNDTAKKIYDSIENGHAVGVSTCGSLFSSEKKVRFEDCMNHTVTATGVKCKGGRLKLELSNSWGISCTDDESSYSRFECQRDKDGLTNGRAWVDYDYLTDHAIEINSF